MQVAINTYIHTQCMPGKQLHTLCTNLMVTNILVIPHTPCPLLASATIIIKNSLVRERPSCSVLLRSHWESKQVSALQCCRQFEHSKPRVKLPKMMLVCLSAVHSDVLYCAAVVTLSGIFHAYILESRK